MVGRGDRTKFNSLSLLMSSSSSYFCFAALLCPLSGCGVIADVESAGGGIRGKGDVVADVSGRCGGEGLIQGNQ